MKHAAIQFVAIALYPFVAYSALRWLDVGRAALVLLCLYGAIALARGMIKPGALWPILRQHAGLLALIGVAVWTQDRRLLQFLPVLLNLYLLVTFGSTLFRGPPMIERFARLVEDDLPDFTLPYCRKITALWCVFFASNAMLIAYLAIAASLETWTLYTGLVCYGVIAALQGSEFLTRKLWFRYYQNAWADRCLARWFPASRTKNGRRSLAYQATRLGKPAAA